MVWNGSCDDLFLRRRQDVFHETFSKTSLRRLKTSSRLFVVKTKDHLDTIYGLSIYVRFKLQTYYHFITRQTNCINLNKINTLKHGNNVEIMKTWFSMKCQTRNTFLAFEFRIALLSLLHLKFEQVIDKKT